MSDLAATLDRLSRLPERDREEIVQWLDEIVDGFEAGPETGLSEELRADLKKVMEEPEDWATDEEVEAFFARHRKPA